MTDADGLDRLLPRHDARAALEIEWDLRPARRVLNRGKEASVPGLVHDISLEGALVQVLEADGREVGAELRIRVLGITGHASIRHARKAPAGGGILYGIRFRGGPPFEQAISDAVTAFRENNSGLRERWEDQR